MKSPLIFEVVGFGVFKAVVGIGTLPVESVAGGSRVFEPITALGIG